MNGIAGLAGAPSMLCCLLMQDNGLADREGVEVRILGDLNRPPRSVQGSAARIMLATAKLKNKRAVLNICFSYT
jgi:undecaprenyl pyrophosphate synthase